VAVDAEEWDAKYASTELLWSAGPNSYVELRTAGIPPGRAFDLACGEGRNAVWLAALGWQVTAVDFSAVAIGRTKARAAAAGEHVAARIDVVQSDALTWRAEEAAYDLAVVAYLHLPAESMTAVLAGVVAGLRPGGRLVAIGHDAENLTDGVGGPQEPDVLWTPELLASAAPAVRWDELGRRQREVSAGIAIDTIGYGQLGSA
jgi:SAM-dependent methyltransferase